MAKPRCSEKRTGAVRTRSQPVARAAAGTVPQPAPGQAPEADPGQLPEADPALAPVSDPGPRPTKFAALPSSLRAATGLVVGACVVTAVVHMLMVFFFVAPPNQITQRYAKPINAWVYPFFEQNWRLFAPDPESQVPQIEARSFRNGRVSGWFDLTALDNAAVRHDVFPSHTAQNMLRRAWTTYVESNGNAPQPTSQRGLMIQKYLRNIAVERLRSHRPGAFQAVQLRVRTRAIPPPTPAGTPRRTAPTAVETRVLPWWKVTPDGN